MSQYQHYESVAIATFGDYWERKLLSDLEETLPRKFDVVRSTLRRGCKFHVQRCSNAINTTFMIYLDMNLLFNTKETLEQLCNFDVLASASLQRVLLVRRCNLTTNIVTTFCICWVSYFSLKYNWRNQIKSIAFYGSSLCGISTPLRNFTQRLQRRICIQYNIQDGALYDNL